MAQYKPFKVSPEGIEHQASFLAENEQRMAEAQSMIYTMAGGGHIGTFAIRQPRDFYLDGRAHARAFSEQAIKQACRILYRAAEIRGDTGNVEIPDYRQVYLNLGVDW